jgi:mono/diheme cytochrome c family protein
MLAHHASGLGFLVDRSGRVWRYPDGLGDPPALDLTGRVSTQHDQGFLGLAISPDANHLYGYFTDERGDSNLVAWRLTDGRPDPGSERRLLWVSQAGRPAHHKGGALLFGPDGLLYLALGDGGRMADRYDDAQRLDSLLGKILRIEPTPEAPEPYLVPPDNPFAHRPRARPEVFAYGLRNPFRIAFDDAGALWIADVGLRCVEEVSVLPAGSPERNLGWNRWEGDRPFVRRTLADYVPPIVTYPHSDEWCSVIGGVVYRGATLVDLQGWYLFGDFCSGRVLALAPDRSHLRDLGVEAPQLVAIVERPDRELDVLSLSGGVGALVAPDAPDPLPLPAPTPPTAAAPGSRPRSAADDAAQGAALFATHCAVCHGENGSGRTGPPLRGGRTVAAFPDRDDQVRLVAHGRGAMPAFASQLSEPELEAVVDYVRERL